MAREGVSRREGAGLLRDGSVATRLPAQDLERARAFYAEKLGLEPIEERPGGLLYECGSGRFALFESAGVPSGEHTQMGWEVGDIEEVVEELRGRGVVFEDIDLPGLRTPGRHCRGRGQLPVQAQPFRHPSLQGRSARSARIEAHRMTLGLADPPASSDAPLSAARISRPRSEQAP